MAKKQPFNKHKQDKLAKKHYNPTHSTMKKTIRPAAKAAGAAAVRAVIKQIKKRG